MDRDELLTEAAQLSNLGVNLGLKASGDPDMLPRRGLLTQLARCLAAPKVHPILVGEPGAGKTATVVSLARLMSSPDASLDSRSLRDRRIVQVTASDFLAGALYANQLEHKTRLVAANCQREKAILFLDDVLSFVGAGSSSSDVDGDVVTILAPFMRRGDVRIVAATTPDGWMQLVRMRPSFARLLTPLGIPEATRDETLDVLHARGAAWQRQYGVRLAPAALDETMDLSERLFPWKSLPGRACDLLDAALAIECAPTRAAVRGPSRGPTIVPPLPRTLDGNDIAHAVRRLTGLPEFLLVPSQPASAEMLRAFFRDRVLGQEHVVEPLIARIQMIKARMCAPGRPLAAYLLAGPSGVGKTLVARTLATLLLGNERRLIRFDMSEFCTIDSVSRFVGGGRAERHAFGLVDAALAEPFPIVLLDEIEKAHPAVFDVLLQLLGEGRLTDDRGRTAHFTNAIILMTSNLGADRVTVEHPAPSGANAGWEARVREAMRRNFRPELANRLTATFAFRPLTRTEIEAVARKEILRVGERKGLAGRFTQVWLTDAAFDAVLRAGYSPEFGVRPMERAVDALVVAPIARFVAEQPSARNVRLLLDLDDDGQTCVRVANPEAASVRPESGTFTHDQRAMIGGERS
jgi:ATP-dependent Clp protease ATP-binding subunit ClpC